MAADIPTWIVLVRDLTNVIRVDNQPALFGAMILDADTGLIRGVSMAAKPRTACVEAMRTALAKPADTLPPAVPGAVVCSTAELATVRRALSSVLGAAAPAITEAAPGAEAEDIFDSLIGHLSGRQQPAEPPLAGDWTILHFLAAEYCRRQPWLRWSDADHLDLVVKADGETMRYVLVVLGQEGVQHGLNMYPGAVMPDLDDLEMADPPRLPAGTILLWLDPEDQTPTELVGKALRYGWPADLELLPTWLTFGEQGPADVDRRAARHLALGLAATLAHDHAKSARKGAGRAGARGRTKGEVMLGDGARGTYTIG